MCSCDSFYKITNNPHQKTPHVAVEGGDHIFRTGVDLCGGSDIIANWSCYTECFVERESYNANLSFQMEPLREKFIMAPHLAD